MAVDTKVRRRDGQVITVKQPLPLPQGVSDYAVSSSNLSSPKACLSPSTPFLTRDGILESSAVRPDRVEQNLEVESLSSTKTQVSVPIKLVEIAVPDDFPKETVQGLVESRLSEINACYSRPAKREHRPDAKIVLILVTDTSGEVTRAKWVTDKREDIALGRCIAEKLKGLHFPVTNGDRDVLITITFLVR